MLRRLAATVIRLDPAGAAKAAPASMRGLGTKPSGAGAAAAVGRRAAGAAPALARAAAPSPPRSARQPSRRPFTTATRTAATASAASPPAAASDAAAAANAPLPPTKTGPASSPVRGAGTGTGGSAASAAGGYRVPPREILEIVDAPPQPSLTYSPDRRTLLQASRPPPLPPLSEVARAELKLAGLRLDHAQRSRSRMGHYTGLELVPATASVPAPLGTADGAVRVTGLPGGALINMVTWSPDGARVAFTVRSAGGAGDPPRHPLQLWVADAATGAARPLLGTAAPVEPSAVDEAKAAAEAAGAEAQAAAAGAPPASSPMPLCPYPTPGLNTVFDSYTWVDARTIVACVVPPGLGAAPRKPPLPPGPRVLDNASGARAQSRTFSDLLRDEGDARALEHVARSELVEVDVATGAWAPMAPPPSSSSSPGAGSNSNNNSASAAAADDNDGAASSMVEAPPPGAAGHVQRSRMYTEVDPSPDGRYVLVSWIERPFSFSVPCGRFPARVELWRRGGRGAASAEDDAAALAAASAAGASARAEAEAADLAPDAVEEAVLSARAKAEAAARAARPAPPPPTACEFVREVAYLPLAEQIPIAFNAVRPGPRAVGWRADRPAEMSWIECRDGGDPDAAASPRDVVLTLGADEAADSLGGGALSPPPPRVVAQTDLRCGGVAWADDGLALLYESWWKTRTSRVWMIAPGEADAAGEAGADASSPSPPPGAAPLALTKRLLFDRNYEDAYGDPGSPLSRRTSLGTYVLARLGGRRRLLMTGGGAGPSGARPFLDVLDLEGDDSARWRRVRLWRSQPPHLEGLGSVMSDGDPDAPVELDGLRVLLARETQQDPPQTWMRTFLLGGGGATGANGGAGARTDALLASAVPATEEDGAAPAPSAAAAASAAAATAASAVSAAASAAAADGAAAATPLLLPPALPLFTLPPLGPLSPAPAAAGSPPAVAGDDAVANAAAAGLSTAAPPPPPPPGAPLAWRERQVTFYPHPHPTLRGAKKEVVRYRRHADGLELTATLHLPPGYDRARDGPLPCLMFAYPREFTTKEAAGQNRRSPHAFAGVGAQSPTLWLARGYCVLEPSFPIVPEDAGGEPNDTFLPQLVGNAQAAVAEVVRRGVADPRRITVGGHSYGAFMAANLAAHAPAGLFAAAIARSGAYNRTLTPFSFQSEERTLWQAPGVYSAMSPFNHADKVTTPLLLIHGEEDENAGTKVIQSERFYEALKGHGKVTRLVVLPCEKHSYAARESVLHALAEQDAWMEAHAGYGRVAEDEEGGMA